MLLFVDLNVSCVLKACIAGNIARARGNMLVRKRRCCKQLSFWLFGLILGLCSIWQVWDQCTKFMKGSTTISLERINIGKIPLPTIALCMRQRFKDGVLASFGLPEDFFDNRDRTELDMQAMPNLAEVWNNATWSLDDLQIDSTQYRCMIHACKLVLRHK